MNIAILHVTLSVTKYHVILANSLVSSFYIVSLQGVLEGLKEVYDEFLLYYPFCYGYWKKLADFVASNQGNEAAYQVTISGRTQSLVRRLCPQPPSRQCIESSEAIV